MLRLNSVLEIEFMRIKVKHINIIISLFYELSSSLIISFFSLDFDDSDEEDIAIDMIKFTVKLLS